MKNNEFIEFIRELVLNQNLAYISFSGILKQIKTNINFSLKRKNGKGIENR